MAELKVWLSIGYEGADHKDVITICDDEVAACKTPEEKEALFKREFQEWANGYIEYSYEPVKGECCCGETDDAWKLCPVHGPKEK